MKPAINNRFPKRWIGRACPSTYWLFVGTMLRTSCTVRETESGPFIKKNLCCSFFCHSRYQPTHPGWGWLSVWCVQASDWCTYPNILKYKNKRYLFLYKHLNPYFVVSSMAIWLKYFKMYATSLDEAPVLLFRHEYKLS